MLGRVGRVAALGSVSSCLRFSLRPLPGSVTDSPLLRGAGLRTEQVISFRLQLLPSHWPAGTHECQVERLSQSPAMPPFLCRVYSSLSPGPTAARMQWKGRHSGHSGSTTPDLGHDGWSSSSHPGPWRTDPTTVKSPINWLIIKFLNRKGRIGSQQGLM